MDEQMQLMFGAMAEMPERHGRPSVDSQVVAADMLKHQAEPARTDQCRCGT
ncbi:hypothetical protein GCM10008949_49850 [Deinococcus humi]|nr:hypothetical protein GCM10008949_49850 [Deinococcus humi]